MNVQIAIFYMGVSLNDHISNKETRI